MPDWPAYVRERLNLRDLRGAQLDHRGRQRDEVHFLHEMRRIATA